MKNNGLNVADMEKERKMIYEIDFYERKRFVDRAQRIGVSTCYFSLFVNSFS